MRVFKFRAWHNIRKEMFRVTNINFDLETQEASFISVADYLYPIPIRDMELMQFTGQHDKNGKDIYEGDLVLIPYMDPVGACFEVEWNDDQAAWDLRERIRGVRYRKIYHGSILWPYLEVVGNLYENPGLLERQL